MPDGEQDVDAVIDAHAEHEREGEHVEKIQRDAEKFQAGDHRADREGEARHEDQQRRNAAVEEREKHDVEKHHHNAHFDQLAVRPRDQIGKRVAPARDVHFHAGHADFFAEAFLLRARRDRFRRREVGRADVWVLRGKKMIEDEPPGRVCGKRRAPVREPRFAARHSGEAVEEREAAAERFGVESLVRQRLRERCARGGEIHGGKFCRVRFQPRGRDRKGGWRVRRPEFSAPDEAVPLLLQAVPAVVEILRIVRFDDHQHRLGGCWQFFLNLPQRKPGAAVLGFQCFWIHLDVQFPDGGEGDAGQQSQQQSRSQGDGQRFFENEADVFLCRVEKPVMPARSVLRAEEHEKNRHHQQSGKADADGDEDAQLRERRAAAQREAGERRRRGDRAKEDASPELFQSTLDRVLVGVAGVASRLVAAVKQHPEIDAQPDENRAEADRDDVQLAENRATGRDRHDAAKQQHMHDCEQRTHTTEADVKHHGDEQHRTEQRRDDVVPHAQRHLGDIRRAAGDEHLRRLAVPACEHAFFKILDLPHHRLAGVRAEAVLIGHDLHDAQRAVGGCERLRLLDRKRAAHRLERFDDQPGRIEFELHLRAGRSGFDLGAEAMQARGDFVRLQKPERGIERGRVEVQQHRQGDRLRLLHRVGRLHRRLRQHAHGPRFLFQNVRKMLGECVEVGFAAFVPDRERERAGLCEFAVKNLERANGVELLRKQIEHVGVHPHQARKQRDRDDDARRDDGVNEPLPVRDEMGDGAGKAHVAKGGKCDGARACAQCFLRREHGGGIRPERRKRKKPAHGSGSV